MSVFSKLQEARVKLQSMQLTKSGHNKFAGYQYFELGDFMPQIQIIFNELGLCGVVSFTDNSATLSIHDVDGGEIVISSPMADAQTKGSLPIQALGSAQTYLRRYLWMTAMEIVEHDALDATTGKETPKSAKSVTVDVWDSLAPEKQAELQSIADTVRELMATDMAQAYGCLQDVADTDEKISLWSRFDSKERSALKRFAQIDSLKKSTEK
jgi:hypothetical protein